MTTPRMDRVRAAQVAAGPWLGLDFAEWRTPALRATAVCVTIEARLRARGWAVRQWPSWLRRFGWTQRTSTTFHILRTICLRTSYTGGNTRDASLMAHEEIHTHQAGLGWWARLKWTLRYLAVRGFRLAVELEAEAHEDAMMVRLGEREADISGEFDPWRCPRVDGWTVPLMVEHVHRRSLALRGAA